MHSVFILFENIYLMIIMWFFGIDIFYFKYFINVFKILPNVKKWTAIILVFENYTTPFWKPISPPNQPLIINV